MSVKALLKTLPKSDMRYCTPEWAKREAQIRQYIAHDRIERFLQWKPCQLSLVKPNADLELGYLQSLPNWQSRWKPAVQESNVGAMPRYPKYLSSSGILLRHAAITAWFEEVTNIDITDYDFILEFGGGHGSMCRLLHRLGFDGTYVIYDLPAIVLLQQYYLGANGIEAVESTWDFDKLPLYTAEYPAEKSLFIATWSLSEAPYSIRDTLLPLITDFQSILIASQMKIRDLDNVAYFQGWQDYLSDMEWHRRDVRKVMWLAGTK